MLIRAIPNVSDSIMQIGKNLKSKKNLEFGFSRKNGTRAKKENFEKFFFLILIK